MNKAASPHRLELDLGVVWASEKDEGKRDSKPNKESLKIILTSRLGFYVNLALWKINLKENLREKQKQAPCWNHKVDKTTDCGTVFDYLSRL